MVVMRGLFAIPRQRQVVCPLDAVGTGPPAPPAPAAPMPRAGGTSRPGAAAAATAFFFAACASLSGHRNGVAASSASWAPVEHGERTPLGGHRKELGPQERHEELHNPRERLLGLGRRPPL